MAGGAEVIYLVALLSMILHEAAHAGVALHQGDDTAKRLGRFTLNPLRHIDPLRTLLVPAGLYVLGLPPIGGMKPLPVNEARLRHGDLSNLAVSAAGVVANLLLAALLWRWYRPGAELNLLLAAFNLLPVPPFDGWRLITIIRRL